MCRYDCGFVQKYKQHYACFSCRQTWKEKYICPSCNKPMTLLGFDFAAPARTQVNQWKKLELLCRYVTNPFNSCGCGGPGYYPKTYGEMKIWISHKKLTNRPKRQRHLKKLLDKKPVIVVKYDS